MRLLLLLLLSSLSSLTCIAQGDYYSFITDKKFRSPQDLIGYNFVPNEMEIPDEDRYELGPDEYSFGITRNNLYVHGEDIKGVYNVNNINTTEYGFKLALINARDPSQQGHLKVILAGRFVDALVFKRSNNDKEIIFFLPDMSDELFAADKAFFTDKTEIELLEADSVWGTTIYPFFRVYTQGNIHERMQYADSTWIGFVEEIEIVEKVKSPKKEKEKKVKKKKKGDFNIETGMHEGETDDVEAVGSETMEVTEAQDSTSVDSLAADPALEVKTKIIKKYYVDIHTNIKNEDGTMEKKLERYPIKKWKEREDELAAPHEERFQIEFETNKGPVYLYLTGRKTISSFEIGGERYLMRGH